MISSEVISFAAVLVVSICVACSVSVLYAFGLRMWANGTLDTEGNAHLLHRIGSVVCFCGCVAIILFALWLMIPLFH